MFDNQKLLVVVDPTEENQTVIERVITICKTRVDNAGNYPSVTLFVTAEIGKSGGGINGGYRDLNWLTSLTEPFKELGADCEVLLSWSDDWSKSILKMANDNNFSSVVLPYQSGNEKQNLSDEFWYLVRHTKVPLILTCSNKPGELRKTVLVARNVHDAKLTELNNRTLDYAKDVAQKNGADVHVSCAYQDSYHYPDRGQLARDTDLPNEQLHVKMGAPEEVINEVAEEIDADLVILAVSQRTDLRSALMGRKMDKIIKSIPRDMLLVV